MNCRRVTVFRTFVFFCSILYSGCLFGQAENQALDRIFSRWNNSTPGVSVAVKLGDSVVYRRGFGLADLEHNIPITPLTVLESGSVAKQFTAMSILLLANEGKLSLADDVRKYVPELPVYATPVTIQMLLNHTSGLKDWGSIGGLSGWERTTRVYTQDLALQIMSNQKSTNFLPGSEYSYSNSNYSLLVTIVERVSGMSLSAFTSARLFVPLQMNNTRWRSNFREIVPNRAIGYRYVESRYEQLMPFEDVHGHGGLLTTVEDLLKWNALLETHSIGGDKVFQERVRRGQLNNGKEITYAAGLQISDYYNFKEIAHSGATAGYRAWLAYYPQKRLSIVLLSNDASLQPSNAGRQIANVFLGTGTEKKGEKKIVWIADSDLKKFEGYFRSVRHFDFHQLKVYGVSLFMDGEAVSFVSADTLSLGTNKWAYVQPGRIQLIQAGDTLSFRKVNPPTMNFDIAGTYHSDEVGADYSFYFDKSELHLKMGHWPAKTLSSVFKDAYTDDDAVFYEFIRNKKGQLIRLEVSVSRAERMIFQRVK
ncbi:MAG: serine hydrolase domain-containing protein [Verrucomicrobiota bacterium]